jgi:hypothetical protein
MMHEIALDVSMAEDQTQIASFGFFPKFQQHVTFT